MSLVSCSSTRAKFANSQYFTQSGSLDEWFCNICTASKNGEIDYVTLRAAQHHERHSQEHAKKVAEAETRMWWGTPTDAAAWTGPMRDQPPLSQAELKVRESRIHVDSVQDMVPFWIRGVEAAEKGEVLRLEEFLESLPTVPEPWGGNEWKNDESGAGWGAGWGVEWTPGSKRGRRGRAWGEGRARKI